MNYNQNVLLLATKNRGKVEEIRLALSEIKITIQSGSDRDDVPEVVETEDSLEGNARLKSETIFRLTGVPTLSDDTGLEVKALDGAPGVRSARFAGEAANPTANRALLLEMLRDQSDRTARFRTVIAFTDASGTHLFEGSCAGSIAKAGRGRGGFGYDEIFVPEGFDSTFAELDVEVKNRISHRGEALRRFVEFIGSHWRFGGSS